MIGPHSTLRSTCRHFVLAGVLLVSLTAWAGDREEVVSQRPFAETVQQLRWNFGGYGLTTVSSMDYQKILKKLKVDSGNAVVFEVMRRDWLKKLMAADPSLGVALPVRVYVYQRNDGETVIAYQKLGHEFSSSDNESIVEFCAMVNEKIGAIVSKAAHLHVSQKAVKTDTGK